MLLIVRTFSVCLASLLYLVQRPALIAHRRLSEHIRYDLGSLLDIKREANCFFS